jgi:hypothetical protein
VLTFKAAKDRTTATPLRDDSVSQDKGLSLNLAAFPTLLPLLPKDLSPASDAIKSESQGDGVSDGTGGGGGGGILQTSSAVGDQDLLAAAEAILAQAKLSLRAPERELMAETVRLRERLRTAAAELDQTQRSLAALSQDRIKVP